MIELPEQIRHIRLFEIKARHFHLVLMKHVPVAHIAARVARPQQFVHAVRALQAHGHALQSVGDFTRDRIAFQAARLLEIGELRDFHTVQPHLPAQAPGAQRRRFPVVFDEANVVNLGIDTQRLQGL